jgi:antitoxin VapB
VNAKAAKQAKLFNTGGSQAVRLPAEYRFAGDAVFVRRDAATGDVILSSRSPSGYATFMATRAAQGEVPADFLSEAERRQGHETRDPFADGNA